MRAVIALALATALVAGCSQGSSAPSTTPASVATTTNVPPSTVHISKPGTQNIREPHGYPVKVDVSTLHRELVDDALRLVHRTGMKLTPGLLITDCSKTDADVCDKGSIDLARTYGSDSCSVVLHRLNIRNHAREFGFHLMRFTAFLVVHENAHCKHDESERPSVHAEAVIAKRIGDPALIARARCDSAAIGRDGGWDTDHNGEVQREC